MPMNEEGKMKKPKSLENEIIKVFTKYDDIYKSIRAPYFSELPIVELDDNSDLTESSSISFAEYLLESVEERLEGVKFIHYGLANEIKNYEKH